MPSPRLLSERNERFRKVRKNKEWKADEGGSVGLANVKNFVSLFPSQPEGAALKSSNKGDSGGLVNTEKFVPLQSPENEGDL